VPVQSAAPDSVFTLISSADQEDETQVLKQPVALSGNPTLLPTRPLPDSGQISTDKTGPAASSPGPSIPGPSIPGSTTPGPSTPGPTDNDRAILEKFEKSAVQASSPSPAQPRVSSGTAQSGVPFAPNATPPRVATASAKWSELPPPTNLAVKQTKGSGSHKGLFAILGIVFLCLVAGGGYAVWRVARARISPKSPLPTPTVVAKPEISPAVVEATVAPTESPVQLVPEAPVDMVAVPAGTYTIGCDDGDDYAKPGHSVQLNGFLIDRTEVTNAQYQKFIAATGHPAPPTWQGETFPEGKDKNPVTDVTWQDAADYASWAGKRLPTEAEWEAAARGTDGRIYPWGNQWDKSLANVDSTGIEDVGSFPGGASPFGALDMVGNVWEWTADEFDLYPGSQAKMPKTIEAGITYRVIRGGAYDVKKPLICSACYRGFVDASKPYAKTGFRCAKDSGSGQR